MNFITYSIFFFIHCYSFTVLLYVRPLPRNSIQRTHNNNNVVLTKFSLLFFTMRDSEEVVSLTSQVLFICWVGVVYKSLSTSTLFLGASSLQYQLFLKSLCTGGLKILSDSKKNTKLWTILFIVLNFDKQKN